MLVLEVSVKREMQKSIKRDIHTIGNNFYSMSKECHTHLDTIELLLLLLLVKLEKLIWHFVSVYFCVVFCFFLRERSPMNCTCIFCCNHDQVLIKAFKCEG